MSRDISASILVLPKYARFLTSNFFARGRASPTSTYVHTESAGDMPRRSNERTHQPTEPDLVELAIALGLLPSSPMFIWVYMQRQRTVRPKLV